MTTSTVSRPAFRLAVVAVLLVAILGTNVQRADALAVVPGVTSAVGTSMGIGVAAAGAGIIAGALIIGWAATGEAPWEWFGGQDPDLSDGSLGPWSMGGVTGHSYAIPEGVVTFDGGTWEYVDGVIKVTPTRLIQSEPKCDGSGGYSKTSNPHTLYPNRCTNGQTFRLLIQDPANWSWVYNNEWSARGFVAATQMTEVSAGVVDVTWTGGTSGAVRIRCDGGSLVNVKEPVAKGETVRVDVGSRCPSATTAEVSSSYRDAHWPFDASATLTRAAGVPAGSTTTTHVAWECTNGTDVQSFTASNDGTVEAPAPVPATQCPSGYRIDSLEAWRTAPGADPRPLYEWNADAPNAGTGVGLDDPANDLAHCYYAGVSYGCRLELQKLIDSSAMLWADCLTLGTQCAGWLTHPNRADIYRCTAVDVRGLVAPKVVPLHDCRVFGPTFEPETQGDVETIPKVDDPEEDPKKLPIPPPNPNPDPEGDDLPYPDDGEQFDPDPRPDEDGDGLPDPRPGISPTNPDLDPSPGATPGLDDGCVPRWWEVLTPWGATKAVACALQWAFVPSPATMTRLQQVPQTATTKAPFGWFSPMLGALDGFDGASSQCWVIDVTMPQGWLGASAPDDERTVHILDSCSDEPLVQAIHNLRPLLTVLAYSSLIMPILWWAWRTYAPASTSSA